MRFDLDGRAAAQDTGDFHRFRNTHPNPAPAVGALNIYDANGKGRISYSETRNHDTAPDRRGHPVREYMRNADGEVVVYEY